MTLVAHFLGYAKDSIKIPTRQIFLMSEAFDPLPILPPITI